MLHAGSHDGVVLCLLVCDFFRCVLFASFVLHFYICSNIQQNIRFCAFSKAVLWCPYLYHAWHSELLKLRETLSCISKFTFAEPRSVSLDVILDNPEDADNDEPVRSIHREEPNCFACENLISPDMLIVWKGDERNLCSPGC